MKIMKNYWDERFELEGKIWGESPSRSAMNALKLFQQESIKRILIPGSGYGRNSKLFSDNGFYVVGIEISSIAYEIAKEFDSKTRFINGSILDKVLEENSFNAVFCFNTLHLFMRKERLKFIKICKDVLKENGLIYFTVFSENDESYGKGKIVEEINTFESKPGRPVHYFTEKDLVEHFLDFNIIDTGIIKEEENHGKVGPHVHVLRYIYARKESL